MSPPEITEVVWIDAGTRMVHTEDGHELPIVLMLDRDGEATDDLDSAVMLMAGKADEWMTIDSTHETQKRIADMVQ